VERRRLAIALSVAGLAVAAAAGIYFYRGRPLTLSAQIKRLPAADSVLVYIDFAQLRSGGFLKTLAGPKSMEDAEYRAFAQKIHLDWREDLDRALIAFAPSGKYMFVDGRFDWNSLRAYVNGSGGECQGEFCRIVGSAPERRISFFPMRHNLMALAVSTDDIAAQRMNGIAPGPDPDPPDAPIWMRIPGSVLRAGDNFPSGTRMFARTLQQADFVTFRFAPEGDRLAARLEVVCRDPQDAAAMAGELTKATALLKDLIQREHMTPNPADFSGVLSSGDFRSESRRVIGHWPIERSFVENLLSGGL
jgi:hypothetical protein